VYHYNDNYENNMGLERISFYGITGYPTAIFNGTVWSVGGTTTYAEWSGVYNNYEAIYNALLDEKTGFSLSLDFFTTGPKITVIATTTYMAESFLKTYRLFYAVTESHIAENWQGGMDSLQFVARAIAPNQDGAIIYDGETPPTKGLVVVDSTTFRFPYGVVKENSELVAFIQNMETQEIAAATRIDLVKPPSAVGENPVQLQPAQFELKQNYPNPFNPDTWIQFQLPEAGEVEIAIYNIQGQLVKNLVAVSFEQGHHKVRWNGEDNLGREAASGVYFVKADYLENRKLIKVVKMK